MTTLIDKIHPFLAGVQKATKKPRVEWMTDDREHLIDLQWHCRGVVAHKLVTQMQSVFQSEGELADALFEVREMMNDRERNSHPALCVAERVTRLAIVAPSYVMRESLGEILDLYHGALSVTAAKRKNQGEEKNFLTHVSRVGSVVCYIRALQESAVAGSLYRDEMRRISLKNVTCAYPIDLRENQQRQRDQIQDEIHEISHLNFLQYLVCCTCILNIAEEEKGDTTAEY